jgi:hypothetical protein
MVIACLVTATMVVCVMLCTSYANSAVDKILKSFTYSGVDDYDLLGEQKEGGEGGEGNPRETWTAYIAEAPIYWYIFGFAITRAWIIGFVGGGLSTLAGTALLIVLGIG